MNMAHAPVNDTHLGMARQALRQGDFAFAKHLLEQGLAANPNDAACLLELSALARWDERSAIADALLTAAFEAEPLISPRRMKGRPVVFRTRCLDSAEYRIAKDKRRGGYKTLFKGGHFAIANLLDKSIVDLHVAQIKDGCTTALDSNQSPRLLINTIACADRGKRSLEALSHFLETHPALPVINHPDAVLKTARDMNFERLNPIEGVRFPRTRRVRVWDAESPQAQTMAACETSFPLIVRIAGRHTGRETYLCRDRAELGRAMQAMESGADAYLIDFADCRHGDGLYRKARAFFIDGAIYPVAYLASDEWQIHSKDRYRLMSDDQRLQEQERAYLGDPAGMVGNRAWKALEKVGRKLGLDFAGIDFTVTPEGELFVFEANAAMRHNFDHATAFPYTRAPLNRISQAFSQMVSRRMRA